MEQEEDEEVMEYVLGLEEEESVMESILAWQVDGAVAAGQADVVVWVLFGSHWTVEIKTKQKQITRFLYLIIKSSTLVYVLLKVIQSHISLRK